VFAGGIRRVFGHEYDPYQRGVTMLVKAVGLTSEAVLPRAEAGTAASSSADPVRWVVLSANGETRRMVVEAVRRNGAIGHAVHGGAGPSRATLVRPYHYAFIDVAHPLGHGDGIDAWVEALRLHRCRLVVRAADGSVDGERWARERGAVLYLPGRLDPVGFERLVHELGSRAAGYSCSPSMRASPSGPMSMWRLMGWQQTGQSST